MQIGAARALRVDTLASAASMMVATNIAGAGSKAVVLVHAVGVLLPVRRHLRLRVVCCLLSLVLTRVHDLHLLLSHVQVSVRLAYARSSRSRRRCSNRSHIEISITSSYSSCRGRLLMVM